jgi:hypothetical protein
MEENRSRMRSETVKAKGNIIITAASFPLRQTPPQVPNSRALRENTRVIDPREGPYSQRSDAICTCVAI